MRLVGVERVDRRGRRTRARSRAAPTSSFVAGHVRDRAEPGQAACGCGSARARATSRASRRRRSRCARARGRPVAQRLVVQRRDVPEPHAAPRRRSTANAGWREEARRRCSTVCSRRVTGRSSTFVSPRIRRIGAMSSSSMCWTMCMTSIWSPSESSGETSATRIVSIPPANSARRHSSAGGAPRAPRAGASRRVQRDQDHHGEQRGPVERPRRSAGLTNVDYAQHCCGMPDRQTPGRGLP